MSTLLIVESESKQHSCGFCCKKYTRKMSYDKHIIMCELLHKSKRQLTAEAEEHEELPSQRKMFSIIQEMALKISQLENKLEEVQKWADTNKRKFKVIPWLNANRCPEHNFGQMLDNLPVREDHIQTIIDHNFYEGLSSIFQEWFTERKPMIGFSQKQGLLYVYQNENDKWTELSHEATIIFFNYVHRKMFNVFNDWRIKHKDFIYYNDAWGDKSSKTMIKFTGVCFKDQGTLTRCRNIVYNAVKLDLKKMVENEFVFEL